MIGKLADGVLPFACDGAAKIAPFLRGKDTGILQGKIIIGIATYAVTDAFQQCLQGVSMRVVQKRIDIHSCKSLLFLCLNNRLMITAEAVHTAQAPPNPRITQVRVCSAGCLSNMNNPPTNPKINVPYFALLAVFARGV